MGEGVTVKVAEAITGVPRRRIQFYTDMGVVTPSIPNPHGSGQGHERYYSKADLKFIILVDLFYRRGPSLRELRDIFYDVDRWEEE